MNTDSEFIPTFTHATERDIDLLLVEEIACSITFITWIAAKAGWQGPISEWRVLHSKRRIKSRREIDIHIEIKTAVKNKPVTLIIENKLHCVSGVGASQ